MNSIAKLPHSTAIEMNSIANGTKPLTKVTNSITMSIAIHVVFHNYNDTALILTSLQTN